MFIDKNLMDQLVSKFNELYITKRKKYLILKNNGEYIQANETTSTNFKPLNDYHIKRHLQGKQTIGVFAGEFNTKFICFDVDFHDPSLAKWYTYKVVDSLKNVGIPEKYIYISTSGNKGYHVDVYFNKMINVEDSKAFFDLVIEQGNLYSEHGQVEFRPSNQGLKLPLGINFKNKDNKSNKCWYVDYHNSLKPITDYNYVLQIEQINADIITIILESFTDLTIVDKPKFTYEGVQVENNKEELDIRHKDLPIYQKNIDPDVTIDAAIELLNNGLKYKGSRHNSLFLLSRYFKYMGCTDKENKNFLIEWLKSQNKELYTTPWEQSIKDIKEIVKYIYDNDLGLTSDNVEIKITYSEMLNIIKAKNMNDKLLAYSMLIHSKRYANKEGIFYMTYKQMAETTGLNESTAYRNIDKLEKLGVIEILERNISSGNSKTKFKKPNRYRMLEVESDIQIELIYETDYINKLTDINEMLTNCICGMFNFHGITTITDLKSLVPKGQYYTYKDIVEGSIVLLDDCLKDK